MRRNFFFYTWPELCCLTFRHSVKGTSAAVVGAKTYEWDVPKIPGISTLQCFEYVKSGVILVRKSHGVGKGLLMKHARYAYESIPVQDMAAVQHVPFKETERSKDNIFAPKMRERDSKVMTRDVTTSQMWP